MRTRFAFVIALLVPALLPAYESMYLPLGRAELQRRVLQKRICEITGGWQETKREVQEIKIGSTRLRIGDDDLLTITGVDKDENPWRVSAGLMQGGSVWQADLDKNGWPDLIFALNTGGNGWAPPVHLLFLMFDSQGRPVPWQVDGYFGADKRGVEDLLDLNHDGHAQLVRQAYDDGYWITSLYQAQEARWQIVHGAFAGRSYPLYTRFTKRANRTPVMPMKGRSPTEDGLSSNLLSSLPPVTLTMVQWGKVERSENPVLAFSDGRSCQPIAWYATLAVVIDRPNRRDVAILRDSHNTLQLLSEIRDRQLPVIVGGHRRWSYVHPQSPTDCTPDFIWAEDREAPAHK